MSKASLPDLLASLDKSVRTQLETVREAHVHPGARGDGSEEVWIELFKKYLPNRYKAQKAFIVDSKNQVSDQIDLVIFDRQYSPFIFSFKGGDYLPAESVYGVFEAKQELNKSTITYAKNKAASVRKLHRTSLPIPTASGTCKPKELPKILSGILAFQSGWTPHFGPPFFDALKASETEEELDMGCVASQGYFRKNENGEYEIFSGVHPTTAFLFQLISQLQRVGTVPMIDLNAYAKWLL